MVLPALFYREEIMTLLYHMSIQASAPVFGLLVGCFIPVASSYIFVPYSRPMVI